MAERMIRDWTQSESVNELSAEAEVFFTRLIMKADDFGNYIGHPKLLRAALFPLRDGMKDALIDSMISECEGVGVIKSYSVDGKRYLNIPNYGQRMRQMRGKYPAPDGNLPTNVRTPLTNAGEEKRREEEIEVEIEVEKKEKSFTLDFYQSQFDSLFLEQMQMHHKGKEVGRAIGESYGHLLSDPLRVKNMDGSDFKKFLNTWLSNTKATKEQHGRVKLL